MQGRRRPRPVHPVVIDLEQLVPRGHRLRRVDSVLDLRFVYSLTKPLYSARMGRASIDPVVFFKMEVVRYLYGIKSNRQLCEDIRVNLAFRWFLRLAVDEQVPDHSSLSKVRDRLDKDVFRAVFERIGGLVVKQGLPLFMLGVVLYGCKPLQQSQDSLSLLAAAGLSDTFGGTEKSI